MEAGTNDRNVEDDNNNLNRLPRFKRRRISGPFSLGDSVDCSQERGAALHNAARGPVSPPRIRRIVDASSREKIKNGTAMEQAPVLIQSPFRLTYIHDLPESKNQGAVKLSDILGHPLIQECWQFNYLFDIDFLMSHFDEDVRASIAVNIFHGCRNEGDSQHLINIASKYPNVKLVKPHLPYQFGTHHCKMMIIIRHDDCAQVIIHTANMIRRDWRNMCQAVWLSPLLPLMTPLLARSTSSESTSSIGSGSRFKHDLILYLREYGLLRTGPLIEKLKLYDFTSIRGAFIGSVPSERRHHSTQQQIARMSEASCWGLQRLKLVLQHVPCGSTSKTEMFSPTIVAQVSSIATLGATSVWIENLFKVMRTTKDQPEASGAPKLADRAQSEAAVSSNIIFPTADEIRRSLDGYAAGASIHTNVKSPAQQKQLQYLRQYMTHWAGHKPGVGIDPIYEAGRRRAAPHIKTYIRFSSPAMESIDWALLTSANLSTQAWGTLPSKDGRALVSSWEVGVLVWPELFAEGVNDTRDAAAASIPPSAESVGNFVMLPTFQTDTPTPADVARLTSDRNKDRIEARDKNYKEDKQPAIVAVGLRMPYDLPLKPYLQGEAPWVATATYDEPDCHGRTWKR